MKKHLIVTGGLIALAGVLASTASADVLYSDDFSGTGSGTGWEVGSSWNNGTLAGGQLTCSQQQAYRNIETPIDLSTADFWFNGHWETHGPATGCWAGVSHYVGTGTDEDMFFGSDTASSDWEFDTDSIPDTNTGVPNYTGQMVQVVVHASTAGIEMWIDPADTSSIAALGTPDASYVGNPFDPADADYGRVRIASGAVAAGIIVVEDIICATTFAEAVGGGPGVAYCPGDGIAPHTPCPCVNNNNGSMGGCDWGNPAFPEGGVLNATGSASMAANDTYLVATGIEDNFGIFFGANNQVNGGNGNPLNDGLRCAGGGLVRLIPPTMASGNQATTPASVQTLDTGAAAGATRRYQYWFRTPTGPCGQMANLTNGYEIVWMP